MQLNGQHLGELHKALLSAFPSRPALEQMIAIDLSENLNSISTGSNLQEIVMALIRWAESQGRLKELVRAATAANPGNLSLKIFAATMEDVNSHP